MIALRLDTNELSGTPSLLILPRVIVRVYHCNHVVVVVAVVAAVQVGLQVALQVIVNAKMCTDSLSVSYPRLTGQQEFKLFMKKKVPSCRTAV